MESRLVERASPAENNETQNVEISSDQHDSSFSPFDKKKQGQLGSEFWSFREGFPSLIFLFRGKVYTFGPFKPGTMWPGALFRIHNNR